MKKNIVIIGAGALAKMVLESILIVNKYNIIGFCADNLVIGEKIFDNYTIIADANLSNLNADKSLYFIVAIGDNDARSLFFENALNKFTAATIIHPSASISISSIIHEGCIVLSNVCVNSSAVVGMNSLVNSGCVIDHDCIVGVHSHLSIGTIINCCKCIPDYFKSEIAEIIY